jgi:ATP-dependent HslUV protease ATP-binding subunit HslU
VLDVLVPPARDAGFAAGSRDEHNATRQKFRKKLREGELDDKEVEIELATASPSMEVMAPPGMEELTQQIQTMFSNLGRERRKPRKLTVKEALKLLADEEASRMVNDEELKTRAIANAESNGIVFLDEIDKIASRSELQGADVSRQGVQRDLLPLVEGTTVNTKYGMVKTDHILFMRRAHFIWPNRRT